MKKIYLFLICLCALLHASAQYYSNQNKVWVFGNYTKVDFNSGAPVASMATIEVGEGCASISNNAGNLLFYTDGGAVYNRLGLIMPAGAVIAPFTFTGSTAQGAVIVPFINDSNKFYVFSLEDYSSGHGKLAYSIVDMTLDWGKGALVPGSIGTIIDTGMSEKMISVRGDNCNVWLLTHKKDSAKFYAYNITSAGISSTPVISKVGAFSGPNRYTFGVMKCSHDRRRIVTTIAAGPVTSLSGIELYDFNPATGIVSNGRVLDSSSSSPYAPYGAEFSPDNSKLYTTAAIRIYQWDISLPSLAAIVASKTFIYSLPIPNPFDLRLGPDGRIYFNNYPDHLGRINLPDVAGFACSCTPLAISIAPERCASGLPSLVWTGGCTTSVERSEDKSSQIELYPNPATNEITIKAHEPLFTTFSIYNAVGQEMLTNNITDPEMTVNVEALPPGQYYVILKGDGPREMLRFVKW